MQKDSDSMQPSTRETPVAITELHMGQYSTYNWGDEEDSSWSPWFPCHSSVTVVKEKKDQITPICHGLILGNGHLNSKVRGVPAFTRNTQVRTRISRPQYDFSLFDGL